MIDGELLLELDESYAIALRLNGKEANFRVWERSKHDSVNGSAGI